MFGSKDLVWLAVISAGWLLCFGCSDPWEEQPVPDDDDIADDDDDDDDDDDSDDDDSDDDDDDSDDDDDADGGVPVATINATPMSGVAPLDVQFSGVVAGGDAPFTFYWAFGDGGEDNIVDPSYTYHLPGTFDVLFEVTDADGDVDSALVTIAVGSDDPADATPGLVINATPTAGDIPLTVAFTSTVSGGDAPMSYDWTFGDGGNSTQPNPSHEYTGAGTYQVTCEVTDADGDSDNKTLTVVAFDPNAPPTHPELSGYEVSTTWVNMATNAAEIYEPNNRSLWAYDFVYWDGYQSYYAATGWLDPYGYASYNLAVTNAGIATGDLFWVDLYTNPGYVPQPADPGVGDMYDSVWGLGSGNTEYISFQWFGPVYGQTYDSYVVIDADEQITEGDEGDNVIGPIPVSVSEDWDWYEVYLFQGEDLTIDVQVPGNPALDFDLDVYGPDAIFEAASHLGSGEDEHIELYNLDEGPWWIRVYPYNNGLLSSDPADSYFIEVAVN